MARIARQHIVTSKGGFVHVFNRVAGAPCYFPFRQPFVRRKFIRWLRYCLRVSCIGCVGYVLMGNHYHLVVRAARFRRLPRKKLHRYAQARWGDLDFTGTRGNSERFDGVFWLEQVRTPGAVASFQPARQQESEELPLPSKGLEPEERE